MSNHTEITRFTHEGLTFILSTEPDTYIRPPWEIGENCGVVTGWVLRDEFDLYRGDGWRNLGARRHETRFYNVAATRVKATAEGWGLSPDAAAALAARLDRTPTPAEVIEAAIDADFAFHAGWFRDEWHYVGVIVTLADLPEARARVWGVEDRAEDYIRLHVAIQLAEQVIEELPARLEQAQAKINAVRVALAGMA